VSRAPLKPGQHRVSLRNGSVTKSISVVINSGVTTTQKVKMQ
jgi:hypothetical protein